jgi:RNA polymerase sigma-70 factor (ECF subfamily)
MNQAKAEQRAAQDDLYEQAMTAYEAALGRLARAYEADPDKRRDLIQDIHLALWRSFASFEGRCSLRTWIYRVAHNTATSYVVRQRRFSPQTLFSLEDIEAAADTSNQERETDERLVLERLLALVHQLNAIDRQIMLMYLEDCDAASIGEVTGLAAGHVRVQIHRIKRILVQRFHAGGRHDP